MTTPAPGAPGTTADPTNAGTTTADGRALPADPRSAPAAPVGDTDDPSPRWSWMERLPLRTRLVTITVLVLAAGLILAAVVTRTVVSGYLVEQTDDQLRQSAKSVAELAVTQPEAAPRFPSEYYVVTHDADGNVDGKPYAWSHNVEKYGTPDLPSESLSEVAARKAVPFTVASSGGSDPAQWRAVGFVSPSTQQSAYVALPLAGVQQTVAYLTRSLLFSALAIVIVGGAISFLLVHRSLRPLRRIEATAAKIADGDLSQRVPERPTSTEVGSLSASLNTMLAQIERAFSAQEESERRMRRFVSDASHELRTPLATVKGYGELYRMGALDTPDKVDDTMGRIEDSARRMSTLVNDLLVLARLDEGRPMRHERVDVAAMARDAAQDLHALDPTREVAVTGLAPGAPAPAAVPVTGDLDRLRQVLTNLVGNVARHTPTGSPAEVAVGQSPDGSAVVEVRDHGAGITPEQAERVFERFYRADSSRNRESGGSGLGMAIVAAIVGAHQGHVSVSETPGGGMTVRVLLPAADRYDGASSSSA
ncbi:sensor histidine kinase [Krasilnikoviella flava]|uniref:histidine kinase n=1 Tax=Krasilnikoviella flava TaxID=526729 RepID=A0A1T5IJA9_9MICO|nr:HAMP domain-containing sensor histidine kinase [Krasilnikoviella flava]SKC39118.1 two-component system, OmpR family, sensor kinase [Krasilnikoviella flava]